ncbi:MAG: 30S ribosomal protein S20 [Kiritimatiellae bacterium]|nr:30S ribosomal protein S20 [Kiritimatiellia bacterium]
MANIKSAIKRAKQAKAHNLRNRACKSMVLAKRKAVLAAIAEGKKDEAATAYSQYSSVLDKAAKKGVIAKNNASRKKSRMALAIQKMA